MDIRRWFKTKNRLKCAVQIMQRVPGLESELNRLREQKFCQWDDPRLRDGHLFNPPDWVQLDLDEQYDYASSAYQVQLVYGYGDIPLHTEKRANDQNGNPYSWIYIESRDLPDCIDVTTDDGGHVQAELGQAFLRIWRKTNKMFICGCGGPLQFRTRMDSYYNWDNKQHIWVYSSSTMIKPVYICTNCHREYEEGELYETVN